MIVVEFDRDEMFIAHNFGGVPSVFSGGPGALGASPRESLVNPRPVGFVRDEFYIPIYWEAED